MVITFNAFRFLLIPLLASATAFSQQLPEDLDLEAPLPVDPAVRQGELQNGLRYYVKENGKPENRASLRLVINAGSLQEAENQRGLAHFIEHMAFNGTEHFQKQELVSFLESLGMRFGRDINASTSFDQTIYKLDVPMDDEAMLDKAFLIMKDWASGITFDPIEIEQERGIIVEEWRSGQGAGQRVRDQQYPLIYYKSHYANRLPIGSMLVVNNAPPERCHDFYRKWYRPNLMAVIAVGDFDGEWIEKKIIERFSELENPEDAPERLAYEVPDHEETLFSIIVDPELTASSASIYLKTDPKPDASALDYRRILVDRIYFSLVNRRLEERTLEASPPYLNASVGHFPLGREKDAYAMMVSFFEDRVEDGLKTLSAEVARASRDGFSQSELDRVKADLLRSYDRIYEERDHSPSGIFADEYTRAFLIDEPIPGIELERLMVQVFVDEIGLEEVNKVGEVFARENSRVILYTAPEKEGLSVPDENSLLAAINEGRDTSLGAYVDAVSDAPLLREVPTPGSIQSEVYHESVDVYDWTLSNGARVLVKSTDFKNDQILMSAYSEGGHSLLMDDEYVAGLTATMILGESGIGEFSTINLEKKLAGTSVGLTPSINFYSEGISGAFSPLDRDVFFKLLYLQITQPNEENLATAFESVRNRVSEVVANRDKSPQSVFQDAIEQKLFGDHVRHRPMNLELLEEMDAGLSFEIFKDRFQNAGDFTFVFVGAIELEPFRECVETYLATLPTRHGESEKARFLGDKPARGRLGVTVEKGLEEKTTVRVIFSGDAEWSPENRYALNFARDLLNLRLREVLREDNSGVYGVGVFANLGRLPYESYTTGLGFNCDPGNAKLLVGLSLREIEYLQINGPRTEDVQKVREQHVRRHETGLQDNGFWLNNIAGMAREDRDFEEIITFVDRVNAFDPEAARQAAINYFDMQNLLVATLKPKYEEN